MSTSMTSDAEILWSDVVDIMQTQNTPPAFMAMLQSCQPQELTEDSLIVTTSRFAKRKIQSNIEVLEECLTQAAFQPLKLVVETQAVTPVQPKPVVEEAITPEQARMYIQQEVQQKQNTGYIPAPQPTTQVMPQPMMPVAPRELTIDERIQRNALIEDITEGDSKLTFDRFIEGDENYFALQAAKQVANGESKAYKILFIYGKSGLGKTHLLKAIQNYIFKNDPGRLCLYRTSKGFQNDYVTALNNTEYSAREALRQNYYDIDVLIIDDIQHLSGQATIQFFFDTFNYLAKEGKWIVVAADRTPPELGLGDKALDDRVVSRLGAGRVIPIQTPSDEFKYVLIKNFYEQMKKDAEAENVSGYSGTISDDNLMLMAELSGNNIRTISGFCSECIIMSSHKESQGKELEREDIIRLARERWNPKRAVITVESIQKATEDEFGVDHDALIGSKRKKEIKEARHVAIWLSRELTDHTLADIGDKFGGRTHATVLNSIDWIEDECKQDRLFYDRISRLKEQIEDNSIL